jgi:hypothetical protein
MWFASFAVIWGCRLTGPIIRLKGLAARETKKGKVRSKYGSYLKP